MKPRSFKTLLRQTTLNWTIGTLLIALGVSFIGALVIRLHQTKSSTIETSKAILAAHRSDLLSQGDTLALELNLKSSFGIQSDETLSFLDSNKHPYIGALTSEKVQPCLESNGFCLNWLEQSVITLTPIYFDENNESLWGYLYLKRSFHIEWASIALIALVLICSLFVQALGTYVSFSRMIRKSGGLIQTWAESVAKSPKTASLNQRAPFDELVGVSTALSHLRETIQTLETQAQERGALTTLQGIGHDILNPVSRLKKIVDLLSKSGGYQLTDAEFLDALKANIRRLSDYAEQLKSLYKIRLGELKSNATQIVHVGDEVVRLAKEFQLDPLVFERALRIHVQVETDAMIHVPRAQFCRVIENLLSNAVHASTERHSQVLMHVASESDRVVISVQDQGEGIKESIRDQIFQSGFTTRPNRGTGLGLFVVQQIVSSLKGEITFETSAQGTIFKVRFPIYEVQNEVQVALGR